MSNVVHFMITIILTAIVYGLVPMLSVLFSRKIQPKTYKTICIVWPVLIALVFIGLNSYFETGNTSSYVPAILWGWVFYKLGIGIIEKRKKKPQVETWYTCPNCGCLVRTGKNCDCGYHVKKGVVVPPAREIVEVYVQPDYKTNYQNELKRRKFSKAEIFHARWAAFIPFVVIALLIASIMGWLEVHELQEKCTYLTSELHNAALSSEAIDTLQRVDYLHELLSEGYCPNPYTNEPMLSIDDFIDYVERVNSYYE